MFLGIDFGSSNIDAVIMKENKIIKEISLDSKLELEEYEFLQYADSNLLEFVSGELHDIKKIFVTGCRANLFPSAWRNIPVQSINEIQAIGSFLWNLNIDRKEALVVSLGSGSCMVSVSDEGIEHAGGTAVGGRTLLGLGKLLTGKETFAELEELAWEGDLSNADLNLNELYPEGIGLLDKNATASHFGNLKDYSKEDLALALFNMCGQVIGSAAGFAAASKFHKRIVFAGKLAESELFQGIIKKRIRALFDMEMVFPRDAGVAVAVGAVINGLNEQKFELR